MPTNESNTATHLEAAEVAAKVAAKVAPKRPAISLDTWAVIFALVVGALIRSGVIKHISW